ncbi:MAG: CRISPR-associated endonuclease Cas1 [Myxococcota bacterium]
MNDRSAVPDLAPARMLNEMAYCPRLFYIEWVDGEFRDNYFTVHGRSVHKRSDEPAGKLPDADALAEDDPFRRVRSLTMSSESEGLIAKMDVIEIESGGVEPVEFKRGKPPPIPERAWEPERIQVCAQALILQDNGYSCDRGWIYFSGSKERVEVPISAELVERARELLVELRAVAAGDTAPPPLIGSPKCKSCSLNAICLPDEVHHLNGDSVPPRGLLVPRDDAQPLYVQESGYRIGLSGLRLIVKDRDGRVDAEARLEHTSHISVFGAVQISTQAVRELCAREIPVCYSSYGGWLYGRTEGLGHKNVGLRIAQFATAASPKECLPIAQSIVAGKIANCRTLLRRNHVSAPDGVLRELRNYARKATQAESAEVLLGIEGSAAKVYFGVFDGMLKAPHENDGDWRFQLEGRNRRPPRDPVNALLSLSYSLLAKDCTLAVVASGFDPYLGFYHRPRYGRPALALDLMEEFRPLVADSVVLRAINNKVVQGRDFIRSGQGVALKGPARKRFIATYEKRMSEVIRHPVFKYRISYRRVLAVHARLLARFILGEIDDPPTFKTR